MVSDWQSKASTKRQSVLDTIPAKWKLEKAIPSVEQQRDVTGAYIQQFLDAKEVEITETDAVGIAEKVGSGAWKAVDVTQAFCHRAALAHQLVRPQYCCLEDTLYAYGALPVPLKSRKLRTSRLQCPACSCSSSILFLLYLV